jgi:hypothetical protein
VRLECRSRPVVREPCEQYVGAIPHEGSVVPWEQGQVARFCPFLNTRTRTPEPARRVSESKGFARTSTTVIRHLHRSSASIGAQGGSRPINFLPKIIKFAGLGRPTSPT